MKNSETRYGWMCKFLHWTVFLLILNQFLVAAAMLTTPEGETTAGFTRGALYEWHKSTGVVIFLVAIVRYAWRRIAPLPDWAPNLSVAEKRAIHWLERVLYLCMFVMPASGFVFVMAGDYPLNFFGFGGVPNFVGVSKTASSIAEWVHKLTAILLGGAMLGHWVVVFRHQLTHGDRYLQRMLPFTHQE